MSDGDLDDFFAKKDKSKKKKRDKYTTNELLEKQKEEQPKAAVVVDKSGVGELKQQAELPPAWGITDAVDSTVDVTVEISAPTRKEQDDQWNDFEDEEKDYSGLRIQNLQIKESEQGGDTDNGEEDGEHEGEAGVTGPWKLSEAQAAAPQHPAPAEEVCQPNVTGGRYIPPSQRNKQPGAKPTRRGKQSAPNITSQDDFPVLGEQTSQEDGSLSAGFERVAQRGAGRVADQGQTMKIELGNKFDALQAGMD